MFLTIFYKKLQIDWILGESYEPNTSRIIARILENTTGTSVLSYGNLLCKNLNDLDTIYKILIDEHEKKEKQKEIELNSLPNLSIESIKQLILPNKND